MRAAEPKPPVRRADLTGAGRRVLLLVSRYHASIGETLLTQTRAGLEAHGVAPEAIEVQQVPGAFELPTAARWAAGTGRYDAIVALGCVVKGETDHDVYINHAVAGSFLRTAEATGVPVIFGVLTTHDLAQAEQRADPRYGGGKGWDCALAALEMAALRERFGNSPGVGSAGPC